MKKIIPDRVLSPEELDQRLVVVSSKGWIALAITCLLVLVALLWAFFGLIPNTYETKTIYLNKQGFEILNSPYAGTIKKVDVQINETVKSGDSLFLIEQKTGVIEKVTAKQAGKAIEFFASTGATVNIGDPLLLIQKLAGQFVFFSFVPIDKAQHIKEGMQVYIKPEGVDVQLYGSIIATVSAVSPYIVSEGALLHLLGNRLLIPYFTQNQPVVLITITPESNPQTASGFKWTSGFGPPGKIDPQTVGTALFMISERQPITYVFPLWRFKKITYHE